MTVQETERLQLEIRQLREDLSRPRPSQELSIEELGSLREAGSWRWYDYITCIPLALSSQPTDVNISINAILDPSSLSFHPFIPFILDPAIHHSSCKM